MDPSARSTAAPPSPAPLSQSRPSLSRSALTTAAPIQDLGRGGTQEFELRSIKFKMYISGLRSIFLFQKKHIFA